MDIIKDHKPQKIIWPVSSALTIVVLSGEMLIAEILALCTVSM